MNALNTDLKGSKVIVLDNETPFVCLAGPGCDPADISSDSIRGHWEDEPNRETSIQGNLIEKIAPGKTIGLKGHATGSGGLQLGRK